MPVPRFADHPTHVRRIVRAALSAADPVAIVRRSLGLKGDRLHVRGRIFRLRPGGRVFLIALGKASVGMAAAAAEILGGRVAEAVAAIPRGAARPRIARLRWIEAGHPVPDAGSLRAGRAAAAVLRQAGQEDLVLVLVSGGGSAMMELPVPGVTLRDLRRLNRMLLRSGLPVDEMNRVRRAISRIKGGGLARLAGPAQVVGLVLSDVVGDRLTAVASGPTVRRRSASHDSNTARQVLRSAGLWSDCPPKIRRALVRRGTPFSASGREVNFLLASNRDVIAAARVEAESLGFPVARGSSQLQGEAGTAGRRIGRALRRAPRPGSLIYGGETAVRVRGRGRGGLGRGGRNQELALAAAGELRGCAAAVLLTLATDGIDGDSPAAGGLVTGKTWDAIARKGRDPARSLARHDSHPALHAVGAALILGQTGTNLNDLVVALAYPTQEASARKQGGS